MIRRALFIGCVFVLPSVAFAQRGGGGGSQATKKSDLFSGLETSKGPTIRSRDVEDMSPVRALIDKRKDLKLTDEQLNGLKEADNKVKDTNAPTFKIIDSLVHELGMTRSNNSDQEAIRKNLVQASLREAIGTARENYDAAAKAAMTSFDADQQAKANEIIEKRKQDGDKTLREKLGGRGGEGRP